MPWGTVQGMQDTDVITCANSRSSSGSAVRADAARYLVIQHPPKQGVCCTRDTTPFFSNFALLQSVLGTGVLAVFVVEYLSQAAVSSHHSLGGDHVFQGSVCLDNPCRLSCHFPPRRTPAVSVGLVVVG